MNTWSHTTVLLNEAVEALVSDPQGCYVDATFGRGGHARGVLAKLGPEGRLLVMDKDPEAIAVATQLAGEDARVALQQAGAAVDQQIAVDVVEALDFTVLVGNQRGPVEIRLAQAPAKTGGLLEVLGEVGTVDQQLLRHAADIDAGAAQVAALGHRHAGTETGGEACRTNAAGAGTDHEQGEVLRPG